MSDFTDKIANTYQELSMATITHQSVDYVIINLEDDPMKSIHVMEIPMDDVAVYQVRAQGKEGHYTTSKSKARDFVWICYLGMIGDLI